jgi:RimJ/RimL family protein N-acetyltransferase
VKLDYPDPPLRDEAVVLRPWREDDVPAVFAAFQDPPLRRFIRTAPSPYRRSDAEAWFRTLPEAHASGTSLNLAVADAKTGAPLGGVSLLRFAWEDRRAEIGFWVAREVRGRGIATRAVRLIARWAFEALDLARVELVAEEANVASQRVAERAGFTREGVLRSYLENRGRRANYVLFSLLPEDL